MAHSRLILAAAVALTAGLAGCAQNGAVQAEADALNPRQLALLERHLGGKTAGEPRTCLPSTLRNNEIIRVSDSILLYRVTRNLVYKNDLRASCPGLARDNDVIVSVIRGTGPCSGDIIRLVDRTSGFQGASCSLGEFTPYRTPRAAE